MEQDKNQLGAEPEQPEATSGATSTEGQRTSKEPRTYSEEEWNQRQSKLDKEANEAKKLAEQASGQAGYWQQEHEALGKQLQELQAEIERKEDAALEGDVEGLSAAKVRRQAVKAKQELEKKEKDLARRESALGAVAKEQAISDLSRQYDVAAETLKIATSYEEAELIAKTINQEREKVHGKGTSEKPFFKPDTGISDAATTSFENTERLYAEGKLTTQEYSEARRKQKID